MSKNDSAPSGAAARLRLAVAAIVSATLLGLLALLPTQVPASPIQSSFRHGYVFTRALVRGPSGAPIWAEYDATGETEAAKDANGDPILGPDGNQVQSPQVTIVQEYGEAVGELEGAYALPAEAYRAYLKAYQDFKNAYGQQEAQRQTEVKTREEYLGMDFTAVVFEPTADDPDHVTEASVYKPELHEDTQSVVLLKSEFIKSREEADRGPLLMESPINLISPDSQLLPEHRALLMSKDGEVLEHSRFNIGLRAAYWRPNDDSVPDPNDDTRLTGKFGEVPVGPMQIVSVYSTLPLQTGGVTGSTGKYSLSYVLPACPGFDFEYSHHIVAEVPYTDFNPRGRSIGRYYQGAQSWDWCLGSAFGATPTSLVGIMAQLSAQAIYATMATPVRRLNLAVDVMILNGQASLRNRDPGNIGPLADPNTVDATLGDLAAIPLAGTTEYEYEPFDPNPQAAPPADAADAPRVDDTDPGHDHRGLLKQISKEDLEETATYAFRISNGQMLISRKKLVPENYVPYNNGNLFQNAPTARFFYKFAMRGPRMGDWLGRNLLSWQARTNVSPQLRGRLADHLRPGEMIKIISVNRKSGYMGSITVPVRNLDQHTRFPEIVLRPPNLKIWAERKHEIEIPDFNRAEEHRELRNRIGHGGAGLTSDQQIAIYSEWLDHDGTPLPTELPGFTGRYARSVDNSLVGTGDEQGEFAIKPGLNLQILKLPEPQVDSGYVYVHVSATPKEELPDFSPGGSDGPLMYRPKHYVPVLVPVSDEARTRSSADANVRAKRRVVATRNFAELILASAKIAEKILAAAQPGDNATDDEIAADAAARALAQTVVPMKANAEIVYIAAVTAIRDREVEPPNEENVLKVFELIQLVRPIEQQARDLVDIYRDLPADVVKAGPMAGQLLVSLEYADIVEAGGVDLSNKALSQAEWKTDAARYAWFFRPEYNVALLDLDLESLDIETRLNDNDPALPPRNQTNLTLNWNLGVAVGSALDYFDLPPQVLLALGYGERIIDLDNIQPEEYLDIEALLALQHGETSTTLSEIWERLTEVDMLALQLYVNQDAANGLYQFMGLPPVMTRVFEVGLERFHLTSSFNAEASSTQTAPVSDDWKVFPFTLIEDSKVKVEIVDKETGDRYTHIEEKELLRGQCQFVVTYDDVRKHDIKPRAGTDFEIEITALTTLEGFSGESKHVIKYPGELDPSRTGRMLGQNVVHDVLVQDGSTTLSRGDFGFPGRGPALAFIRNYTNLDARRDGPLGQGWSHNYLISLQPIAYGDTDEPANPQNLPTWVTERRNQYFPPPGTSTEQVSGICAPNTFENDPMQDPPLKMVAVSNGGLFKKVKVAGEEKWLPQRGNHGRLEEAPDSFLFTSKDGTKYRFPNRRIEAPDAICNDPGLVGFDDLLYFRVGLPPAAFRLRERLAPEPTEPFFVEWIEDRYENRMTLDYTEFVDEDDYAERLEKCRAAAKRPLLRVTKVTDAVERTLELSYEKIGRRPRIVRVDGPGGSSLTMEYQVEELEQQPGDPLREVAMLTELVKNGESTEGYGYAKEPEHDSFNLVSAADPNGHTMAYAYGATVPPDMDSFVAEMHPDDVISTVTYPDSSAATFTYPEATERKVTDLMGSETSYTLNYWGNPRKIVEPMGKSTETTWSVDDSAANDNVMLTRKDALGRVWTYAHDAQGNVTQETDPAGKSSVSTYQQEFSLLTSHKDRNGITRSWTYDDKGSLIEEVDGEGNSASHNPNSTGERASTTNARGYTTSFSYDGWGLLEELAEPEGRTTHYSNDERGRRLTMTDPNGGLWSYGYDGLDRMTSEADPMDGVREFDYDPKGNKKREVNKLGLVLNYNYDERDRVKSVSRSGGADLAASQTFGYDENGNLTSETDWKGQGSSHGYDALNRPVLTTDRMGQPFSFGYDVIGNKTQETDPRGVAVTYVYDELDRVSSKTEAGLRTTTYAYDNEGHPILMTDGLGRKTATEYDNEYRVVSVTQAQGTAESRTATSDYDAAGNLVANVDPEGAVTLFEFDGLDRITHKTEAAGSSAARASTYGYDPNGNIVALTNGRGYLTSTEYDALNRAVSVSVSGIANSQYDYDAEGNRTAETTPRGYSRSWQYDAASRVLVAKAADGGVTTTKYDKNGNVRQVTDPRGATKLNQYDALDRIMSLSDAGLRTASFGYDAVGNRTSETNGRGIATILEYDELNRLVSRTEAGLRTTVSTYDVMDNVKTVVDARGFTTTTDYDSLNRPIKVTDALSQFTTVAYNAVDKVIEQTDRRGNSTTLEYDALHRRTRVAEPEGRETSIAYDENDNVVTVTDANGNTTTNSYDALDRAELTMHPGGGQTQRSFDSEGNLLSETDEAGQTAYFGYDAEGRQKSVTNAAGEMLSYEYDLNGNRTSVQRPAGGTWTYAFDPVNRLDSVTDPLSNLTDYGYDEEDNLVSQTDAAGSAVSYSYDGLDRRESMTQPGGLVTSYGYDKNDNQTAITDPNGQSITYTYDALNRKKTASYPDTGAAGYRIASITYGYDANGNLTSVTESKSRPSGGAWSDETTYTYDALNRETGNLQRGQSVGYTYDPISNRKSVISAGGGTAYSYNARNWLVAVTVQGEGATTYTYFPDGKVQTVTAPNGTKTEHSYDSADREKTITHSASGVEFLKLTYDYDSNGNRTQQQERRENVTRVTAYVFDSADRLTGTTEAPSATGRGIGPRTTSFTLDEVGNRTVETVSDNGYNYQRSYSYDAVHRLESVDSSVDSEPDQNFAYDNNGNTLEIVATTNGVQSITNLEYDGRDQLVYVARGPPGNASPAGAFDYDYRGMRIRQDGTPRGNIQTVYDNSAVLEEHSDGALLAHYRYGYQALSLLRTDGSASGTQYFHQDSLGSTLSLTGDNGAREASYELDAWGNLTSKSGDSPNRQIFTGQEHDEATGLIYFGARYYDPTTGRFVTQDSYLGSPGVPPSLHRYQYANSNPTVYVDPDGHAAGTVTGGLLGAAWGFGQMVGGMANDLYNGRSRGTSDYLAVWGQNIVGGLELGASVDVAVFTGGLGLAASGALGGAGMNALTLQGEAASAKQFGSEQLEGAAYGAVGGVVIGKLAPYAGEAILAAASRSKVLQAGVDAAASGLQRIGGSLAGSQVAADIRQVTTQVVASTRSAAQAASKVPGVTAITTEVRTATQFVGTRLAQSTRGTQPVQMYLVKWNAKYEQWTREAVVNRVSTQHAAVNGMLNDLEKATSLMGVHVRRAYGDDVMEFTLLHNPTASYGGWLRQKVGAAGDFLESIRDKLGFTTYVTRRLMHVIRDLGGNEAKWVAHSQGGLILNEAIMRSRGVDMSKMAVAFHAGANNRWVTNFILRRRGIQEFRGYLDNADDVVPNIIGLNNLSRFKECARMTPTVCGFGKPGGPESPHTYPAKGPYEGGWSRSGESK